MIPAWEYEDQSSMDTSNGCSANSKRPRTRSDSGKNFYHKAQYYRYFFKYHEYKYPNQSVNQKVIVVVESSMVSK